MPIQQTIGIILAAVVAAISIPNILDELTATGRVARKLDRMLSIAGKVQHDGTRLAISGESDRMALRLASLIAIRPSRRDWVETALFGLAPALWYVAFWVWPFDGWMREHLRLVLPIALVVFVALQQVQHTAATRMGTLHNNRRLYVRLGAPADPPLLSIPTVRDYLLRPTLTSDAVFRMGERAKAEADQEGVDLPLVDYVRVAIQESESRCYRHAPRTR